MPYFEDRTAPAKSFIEPDYADARGVYVAEFRAKWQEILSALSDEMNKVIAATGKDMSMGPKNAHLANIHHTGFLVAIDQAKDHAIKYVLASACTKKSEVDE